MKVYVQAQQKKKECICLIYIYIFRWIPVRSYHLTGDTEQILEKTIDFIQEYFSSKQEKKCYINFQKHTKLIVGMWKQCKNHMEIEQVTCTLWIGTGSPDSTAIAYGVLQSALQLGIQKILEYNHTAIHSIQIQPNFYESQLDFTVSFTGKFSLFFMIQQGIRIKNILGKGGLNG